MSEDDTVWDKAQNPQALRQAGSWVVCGDCTFFTQNSMLLLKELTLVVATQMVSMTHPIQPLPSLETVERVECAGLQACRVLRDVSATTHLSARRLLDGWGCGRVAGVLRAT